jgi:hypothetical protein
MAEIPSAEAVSLFSKWERQNSNLAVLGSNSSAVVSVRNARVSLCFDDLLQLSFAGDGIMRLFIRGALFAPADPRDFPEDSKAWSARCGPGIQIRFVNTEMECFLFPQREIKPA